MRRALAAALALAAVAACDFQAAFDDYCTATGRCDGGMGDDGGAGGGGGGGAIGGGAGGGAMGGGAGGGAMGGGAGGGVMGGGAGGGAMGGGAGGGATGGGGGALQTCEFASLSWTGGSAGYVGECVSGVLSHPKPDILPDSTCSVPVVTNSAPPGLSLYGSGDCTAPPRVNSLPHRLMASRFGTFSWSASATDSRGTHDSPNYTFTGKARLAVDAGTGKVQVGQCNGLQVLALSADGGLAQANADITLQVSLQQGVTFLTNCGATQFASGQAAMSIGVNPTAPGQVDVNLGGVAPFDSLAFSVTACTGASGGCTGAGDCCSNSCVSQVCQ